MTRFPPTLVRRLVVAPIVLVVDAGLVVLSPLLGLAAAVVSPVFGGRRALQVVAITAEFAARHLASTVACFGLWIRSGFGLRAGSARHEAAHYAVLRWFVAGVYRSMTRTGKVNVRVTESDAAEELLSAKQRPVIVLARHAGEGDSLLVLHHLLCRHGRRPRVALHGALRIDPLIDVLGRRLPNRFITPGGGGTEEEIAGMSQGLGGADAVLIFPEGANFTPARRRRGIERLRRGGHHEEAESAHAMEHVVAPRPGGTIAALDAAPEADVVFMGHFGIPEGIRDLWEQLPADQTVDVRLWAVPAGDRPTDRDEQIDWLFSWWTTLDRWVAERHAVRAA